MDIPKIKFTQNPNFKVYKIGELLEFYSRKCELISDEKYQLVTVKRRNEGIVNRGKFKGKEIKTPTQFYIETGDFLISKRQIVHGACEIVPYQFNNAIVSNEYTVAKGKQNLLITEYFNLLSKTSFMKKHYFLSSYGVDIEKMVFNVEDWKKRAIYVPSTEEQRKVIDFFSTINKEIQFQQEKTNLLKEQKKGYIQKLFKQEIRFKDGNGEGYPEWKVTKLNKIAIKISKKNKDLSVTNVISNSAKNGLVSQNDYFDKDIANKENIGGYYIISKGDFVYNPRISSEAPYGPINIYHVENDGIVSPLYTCFSIEDKSVNKEFIYYYFKSSLWHRYIYINGDSGARHDRVSIKDSVFFEMDMLLPCQKEQEKIVQFLSKIDEKIRLEQQKMDDLQARKKGFMQQMFI
ncbi:restriction endonuclease subunit S [Bacillus cereus]|uniref:restriction endonuclease subunit S n=1 Tax=Bacillus cereus TaxID=1396 RepID=UPI001BD9EB1D|nr:restriction endonuclease subunit S [Bacillus cereus]MBT0788174.1 restriction endonuclease subunit S [Bacillus cereus]